MRFSISNKLPLESKKHPLNPFGLLLESNSSDSNIREFKPIDLCRIIWEHRLIILRGFSLLKSDELTDYCQTWGKLLGWNFGTVLNLIVHENPDNYLFTNGNVPFHWDGAFASAVPRFLFFQCLKAPTPGSGGESLFCDTTKIWQNANSSQREIWQQTEVTYSTQKVAHYGGQITVPLVSKHPITGKTTLRFAEPVDPERGYLNPLSLEVAGMSEEQQGEFLDDLITTLYLPENCFTHEWKQGDILIADNHALLHGRHLFKSNSSRHLQRVHIL